MCKFKVLIIHLCFKENNQIVEDKIWRYGADFAICIDTYIYAYMHTHLRLFLLY